MSGWFRLGRFIAVSDRLYAVGVFSGELLDENGSWVGTGSRRQTAPADITPTPHGLLALIGPVSLDLLGLSVNVGPFSVDARRGAPVARLSGGYPTSVLNRPTRTQPASTT